MFSSHLDYCSSLLAGLAFILDLLYNCLSFSSYSDVLIMALFFD
jgi:hypothetical protein